MFQTKIFVIVVLILSCQAATLQSARCEVNLSDARFFPSFTSLSGENPATDAERIGSTSRPKVAHEQPSSRGPASSTGEPGRDSIGGLPYSAGGAQ